MRHAIPISVVLVLHTVPGFSQQMVFDARGYSCPLVVANKCSWSVDTLRWTVSSAPSNIGTDLARRVIEPAAEAWDSVVPFEIKYVAATGGQKLDEVPDITILWALAGKDDPLWQPREAVATLPEIASY